MTTQPPELGSTVGASGHEKRFSLLNIFQFLGASTIVGFVTWSLGSYIGAKANQQQQLNTFINTISDFMIQNNLDGQSSGKPQLPAVSRAARGYALNTLSTLDGIVWIEDKPKKIAMLKFLYDSELIGFCKNTVLGSKSLAQEDQSLRCQASRINLKDARLAGLNFTDLSPFLRGINLSGTNLARANFSGNDLTYAQFYRSRLRSSNFSNSILHGANFASSYLVDADLSKADLSRSNLSNSQICGSDFRGAVGLETARMTAVTFDESTKLPKKVKQRLIADKGILVGPRYTIKGCKPVSGAGE